MPVKMSERMGRDGWNLSGAALKRPKNSALEKARKVAALRAVAAEAARQKAAKPAAASKPTAAKTPSPTRSERMDDPDLARGGMKRRTADFRDAPRTMQTTSAPTRSAAPTKPVLSPSARMAQRNKETIDAASKLTNLDRQSIQRMINRRAKMGEPMGPGDVQDIVARREARAEYIANINKEFGPMAGVILKRPSRFTEPVLNAIRSVKGVPGKHVIPLVGKKNRTFTIWNDPQGKLTDFKTKTKSKGGWKKIVSVVGTVMSFVPIPVVAAIGRVATAVVGVMDGIKSGNILGAVASAVGGAAAGVGAFASKAVLAENLRKASTVLQVGSAVKNKSAVGLINAAGNFAGEFNLDVDPTKVVAATNLISGARDGNLADVLSTAATFATGNKNFESAKVLRAAATVAGVKKGLDDDDLTQVARHLGMAVNDVQMHNLRNKIEPNRPDANVEVPDDAVEIPASHKATNVDAKEKLGPIHVEAKQELGPIHVTAKKRPVKAPADPSVAVEFEPHAGVADKDYALPSRLGTARGVQVDPTDDANYPPAGFLLGTAQGPARLPEKPTNTKVPMKTELKPLHGEKRVQLKHAGNKADGVRVQLEDGRVLKFDGYVGEGKDRRYFRKLPSAPNRGAGFPDGSVLYGYYKPGETKVSQTVRQPAGLTASYRADERPAPHGAYYEVTHNSVGAANGTPALNITAGPAYDPKNTLRLGKESQRVLVDGGNFQVNFDEVAHFSAHGTTTGFDGTTNKQAARIVAREIIKSNASRGDNTIKQVLVSACLQCDVDSDRMPDDPRNNGQRFRDELNQILVKEGHAPVKVAIASQPGTVLNGKTDPIKGQVLQTSVEYPYGQTRLDLETLKKLGAETARYVDVDVARTNAARTHVKRAIGEGARKVGDKLPYVSAVIDAHRFANAEDKSKAAAEIAGGNGGAAVAAAPVSVVALPMLAGGPIGVLGYLGSVGAASYAGGYVGEKYGAAMHDLVQRPHVYTPGRRGRTSVRTSRRQHAVRIKQNLNR